MAPSKMLFDESEAKDSQPKRYTESLFSFLNRSDWPEICRARKQLKVWLNAYPETDRADVLSRLRSPDDFNCQSAFFELLLHELLLSLGCEVDVHCSAVTERNVPDFLVKSGADYCCLEAAVVTDESIAQRASQNMVNVVYDLLNELDSPDFFIGMSLRGTPKTPPPARSLLVFLKRHLSQLDIAVVERTMDELEPLARLPRWPYEHDGWKIQFFPIPKSSKLRGQSGVRPVGLVMPEPQWRSTRDSVQKALERKAHRYGAHQTPFVIALNVTNGFLNQIDIADALFGSEAVSVEWTGDGFSDRPSRVPDGLWRNSKGPRYTRVSAVLIFFNAQPWSTDRVRSRLYLNPWARKPYEGELTRLEKWVVRDSQMIVEPGVSIGEILASRAVG